MSMPWTLKGTRTSDARSPAQTCDEDPLLAYLVGSMYASRAPIVSAMVTNALVTIAAYAITRASIFVVFLFAQVMIGIARTLRFAIWEKSGFSAKSATPTTTRSPGRI